MPDPIYTPDNTQAAYQLNWVLSVFPNSPLPAADEWSASLKMAVEKDAVRILEHKQGLDCEQFLVSTQPSVSPAEVVRSIKGRCQCLIRETHPQAFRGNFQIESIGSAKHDAVDAYVGKQAERHPLADPRVQEIMQSMQFHDPLIDLAKMQRSSHGLYRHNLHVVIEHDKGLRDVRTERVVATRDMIRRTCLKHEWRLARIGLVADHIHLEIGCRIVDSPQQVVLSLLNNLAFAHGMTRVYRFGFYAGSFGPMDLGAIWNARRSAKEGGQETGSTIERIPI